MKNRANCDDDDNKRRKYFRQPKIYQNQYIDQLIENDSVILQEKVEDDSSTDCVLLYMFIKEMNNIYLMLGREEH